MRTADELTQRLRQIDGRGYKAYKSIAGEYELDDLWLSIDHVQGDPFASPSRLRVRVPASIAGFPESVREGRARQVALRDFLARRFATSARVASSKRGLGSSGLIAIDEPGQEVLDRSAVIECDGVIEARFVLGLPARGRTVLGRQAAQMLGESVPEVARSSLRYSALDHAALRRHVDTVHDARWLRSRLRDLGLIGFVGNGANLPRRSGMDPRPLRGGVPFRAPDSLRVEIDLPCQGRVQGLGIPPGVTLIVGGGYHGKSTLLRALMLGVWDHAPDDGRELVVTDPDVVKVRAEDGRAVHAADLSAFLGELPDGSQPRAFSTANASGSTSQAAAIAEALESGASVLILDEDTSATNFMIRDRRMQALVPPGDEPITPFVDRVRQLWEDNGVSTVLVMGGSGDYLDVADTVIAMRQYRPHDVTERGREVADRFPTGRELERADAPIAPQRRTIDGASLDPSRGRRAVKIAARGTDALSYGRTGIDLTAVEQLVDASQLRSIGAAMAWARVTATAGDTLESILDRVGRRLQQDGLGSLVADPRGDLAEFRRHELAATISRLRSLSTQP